VLQKEYIVQVMDDIKTWQDYFATGELDDLKIPTIGNPFGYLVNGVLVTGSSVSLNYYAKRSNTMVADIAHPIVAEIGPGFGGLFYYLLAENPSAVCLGFDLLEVLVIAQYFLMMASPDKRFLLFGEPGSEGKLIKKNLDNYDVALLPNFKLVDLENEIVDLFLNFHSLSEMEPITINEYIYQISRVTRGFFFHENSQIAYPIGYGKREIPAREFNISPKDFKLLYKMPALWSEPRYMEFLYMKCMPVKITLPR
jgi:putative sugar O-methyltransferase